MPNEQFEMVLIEFEFATFVVWECDGGATPVTQRDPRVRWVMSMPVDGCDPDDERIATMEECAIMKCDILNTRAAKRK